VSCDYPNCMDILCRSWYISSADISSIYSVNQSGQGVKNLPMVARCQNRFKIQNPNNIQTKIVLGTIATQENNSMCELVTTQYPLTNRICESGRAALCPLHRHFPVAPCAAGCHVPASQSRRIARDSAHAMHKTCTERETDLFDPHKLTHIISLELVRTLSVQIQNVLAPTPIYSSIALKFTYMNAYIDIYACPRWSWT
jgi:hypothetical protein